MGQIITSIIDPAAAGAALPGQKESGDRYLVREFGTRVLTVVVDGIGHGSDAALAAQGVVNLLRSCPEDSVIPLLRMCHDKLRGTRGVVLSMALFDAAEATMTWLGVGNVEGILLRHDPHVVPGKETLLLRGGVVGDHLPRLLATIVPVVKGDLLILATDGIRNGFADNTNLADEPQRIADRILSQYRRGNDDALVFVARYIGKP